MPDAFARGCWVFEVQLHSCKRHTAMQEDPDTRLSIIFQISVYARRIISQPDNADYSTHCAGFGPRCAGANAGGTWVVLMLRREYPCRNQAAMYPDFRETRRLGFGCRWRVASGLTSNFDLGPHPVPGNHSFDLWYRNPCWYDLLPPPDWWERSRGVLPQLRVRGIKTIPGNKEKYLSYKRYAPTTAGPHPTSARRGSFTVYD